MQDIYVFDMGGVIKEPFNLEKFYLYLSTKIEYKEFVDYWLLNIPLVETGKITSNEFLSKILNYSKSSKTIDEVKKIYGMCTGNLYNDTMEIIYYLKNKGKKVYLLSDLKDIDFEYLKQKLDINIFTEPFLSYKLGFMKSDTEIFKILIKKLKVNPNNIYFFDNEERNILNAKKMGINAYKVDGKNIKRKFKEKNF